MPFVGCGDNATLSSIHFVKMINLLLTYMNSELQPQKVMPQVMALGRTMTWWTSSLLQAGQQTIFPCSGYLPLDRYPNI